MGVPLVKESDGSGITCLGSRRSYSVPRRQPYIQLEDANNKGPQVTLARMFHDPQIYLVQSQDFVCSVRLVMAQGKNWI